MTEVLSNGRDGFGSANNSKSLAGLVINMETARQKMKVAVIFRFKSTFLRP